MAEHILKTWSDPFLAVEDGSKRFEFRKNDRDYQIGDTLLLQMYDPNHHGYSTGRQRDFTADHGATYGDYIRDDNGKVREVRVRVTYITTDVRFGVPPGFCVMSLARYTPAKSDTKPAADPDRT